MWNFSAMKCFCAVICFFVVLTTLTSAAPYPDYDSNIRDLFEILLQRDALDENRLSGLHQVVRKASRSPQLRLRFGKRSDPSVLPMSAYMMAEQDK